MTQTLQSIVSIYIALAIFFHTIACS